jgi:DNA topoisomerase III
MAKALIIAEKPSVAADIARALGGFEKRDDYFESAQFVLSSAIGHLLELRVPEAHEVKRGKWTFAQLPVIPPHFELNPIEKTESRLKLLTRLMKRKDVDGLVNACDAGREGELIFRYIARHVGVNKPIRRLWLQSMTPAAIREGFGRLRDDAAMRPLADAAVCRSEADWLVGINGTRAMTAFNSKTGGFHLTTVGRVQTPTLAIVVEREERIKGFRPRSYWEVHGTFQTQAGPYAGRWFDEQFAREKNGDSDLKAERLWDAGRAEAIRAKCLGRPGVVTEESKPTSQSPPLLYDLTSLQREANGRFGFSAQRTLQLAQALYERHKVITYPRTDARALPEDYLETVKGTLTALRDQSPYENWAGRILESEWVRPNRRIFNNAKISDHFAIIPTPQAPRHLTDVEQKLYDLIVKRFLAVFFPAAEFLVTTRITRVEGEPFKTEGKVMLNAGWLVVYGKEIQGDDSPSLPPVTAGEAVSTSDIEVKGLETKPPPRFNEATLLTAMEGAGRLVDDEELRAAMSEKGLGTPATRAAIIEGLLYEKYLLRHGRELQPTAKAFSLMALLRGLGVPELTSPELTGQWEFKLKQMERGQLARETFMEEIRSMTRDIVQKAKEHEHDTIPGDFGRLEAECPKCRSEIKETYKKFQCTGEGCDFALWKIVAGRQFEPEEIETLIREKVVGPLQGFRSKTGRPFNAVIRLSAEFKPEFDFGQNAAGSDGPGESQTARGDFTGQESVGTCPKCGARLFESGNQFVCEKSAGEPRACDFRCGRIILQQSVDRAQLTKLLSEGRTDLLTKFVSKRGRPFSAFLVLDGEKNVRFEFEKRERGAGKTRRSAEPTEPAPKLDFTGQQPVGRCPRCGGRVFESETDYLCENSQAESRPCRFKTGKVILHQALSREEVQRLLETGRTGLIEGFISKSGRPFKAWLVVQDRKKVGFEFPDRDA